MLRYGVFLLLLTPSGQAWWFVFISNHCFWCPSSCCYCCWGSRSQHECCFCRCGHHSAKQLGWTCLLGLVITEITFKTSPMFGCPGMSTWKVKVTNCLVGELWKQTGDHFPWWCRFLARTYCRLCWHLFMGQCVFVLPERLHPTKQKVHLMAEKCFGLPSVGKNFHMSWD